MAQSIPDVAPSPGSGEISSAMEESGCFGESPLQKQDCSNIIHPLPRNFIWRLGGGRRNSSADETRDQKELQDMAVDVPVLRETFDPWSNGQHNEDEKRQDGRCKGCDKISRTRAARAATAAAAAATRPLEDPKPSKCCLRIILIQD